MDRLIYIASANAGQLLNQQAVVAHNLANASTAGFKADTTVFRVAPVTGDGPATRAFAVVTTPGTDMTPGPVQATGRDLDVAIQGEGLFAVQANDGSEAYTRNGSFQVSSDGTLTTGNGLVVLGTGGPLSIPPNSKVAIATDGTVSVTTAGQSAANVQVVGQLKLVDPEAGALTKSGDGLFRTRDGDPADAADTVTVASGALEASNANPVSTMVDMISLARQFDMQMKLLQNAESDAQKATQLLSSAAA